MAFNSAADWVSTEDVFLLRNPDVVWDTGRPIWTHKHTVGGKWLETQYIVHVTLEEVK